MQLGGDRRVVIIELTESGRVAADAIRRSIADLEDRALRELPAEALTGFREVLRALREVAP
jgi:DNA-binding MarR family transcriptional regulator